MTSLSDCNAVLNQHPNDQKMTKELFFKNLTAIIEDPNEKNAVKGKYHKSTKEILLFPAVDQIIKKKYANAQSFNEEEVKHGVEGLKIFFWLRPNSRRLITNIETNLDYPKLLCNFNAFTESNKKRMFCYDKRDKQYLLNYSLLKGCDSDVWSFVLAATAQDALQRIDLETKTTLYRRILEFLVVGGLCTGIIFAGCYTNKIPVCVQTNISPLFGHSLFKLLVIPLYFLSTIIAAWKYMRYLVVDNDECEEHYQVYLDILTSLCQKSGEYAQTYRKICELIGRTSDKIDEDCTKLFSIRDLD